MAINIKSLKIGDTVKVRAYGDEILTRRVAWLGSDRKGGIVGICTDEEFTDAKRHKRDPRFVGFRIWDVTEHVSANPKEGR